MKPKILIASSSFYRFPKVSKETIKDLLADYQIIKNPYGRRMTAEELIKYGQGCDGIIAGLEGFDSHILKQLPQLKCISRDGVGMDNIDLKLAKKLGIKILNTPDANTQAVAELTIGLIISLLRNISQLNLSTHQSQWDQVHGELLSGKTVGIIGVGRIGKRLTEFLKPFGCQIIGNDIEPDRQWFKKYQINYVTKKQLYHKSDIISLHTSYLPQNKHLIDNQAFSQMKKGVIILNLSRGLVIKEKDLIKNLRLGKVAAAALDVFEKEPYQGQLTKMNNVILTPHIGGSTHQSRYNMQIGAINNLLNYFKNEN